MAFFFLVSWFFMGTAITHCSTTSTALGSDSTGGLAWVQWAAGNDLTWGHTDKSNYPFGETLGKPQFITSTVFIIFYKLFSTLTTPICGLNLMVLLGYMSTALTMYGLVRWLLKRNDIALLAGFAAAYVPFHQLKAQSHINYIYGSTFIATIWAYLWFMSRPSYKKALLLGAVSSIGFYFDGYFILISAIVIGSLLTSSFVFDLGKLLFVRGGRREIFNQALQRAKYLVISVLLLGLLLTPILITYAKNGEAIEQSLATVRSSIRGETELYGARPIEFVLPSYNSAFVPNNYLSWRSTKLHGSNFSESTLYMSYTVIVLALVATGCLAYRKSRASKLQNMPYPGLVFTLVFAFAACFALSLPYLVTILGHEIRTPVAALVKFTSNWRVLSRLFLAMHPLVVIMASLGLYMITKNQSKYWKLGIVGLCGLVLFMEYLPAPLHSNGDLYKNTPPIYKQLQRDKNTKLVAEYPLADFSYTPEIFTFQPVHNKTLVNASDGSISKGPFDASIAGLNDPQTLGALRKLNVDVIITHGFSSDNAGLTTYYPATLNRGADGKINKAASTYAYRINASVPSRQSLLVIEKGYDYLSVDTKQLSHRIITEKAVMRAENISSTRPLAPKYNISFSANSICQSNASLIITQAGQTLWTGSVSTNPTAIYLSIDAGDVSVKTAICAVDITKLSAELAT